MHIIKFILTIAGLIVIDTFCPIAAMAVIGIFIWIGTK